MSKTLEQKWVIVREHYEKAYKVKFKKRPNDIEVEKLYRALEDLRRTEFIYKKKRV